MSDSATQSHLTCDVMTFSPFFRHRWQAVQWQTAAAERRAASPGRIGTIIITYYNIHYYIISQRQTAAAERWAASPAGPALPTAPGRAAAQLRRWRRPSCGGRPDGRRAFQTCGGGRWRPDSGSLAALQRQSARKAVGQGGWPPGQGPQRPSSASLPSTAMPPPTSARPAALARPAVSAAVTVRRTAAECAIIAWPHGPQHPGPTVHRT